MENKNIIIILVAIIIVLAAIAGFMFSQSQNPKNGCEVKVTSDPNLYEGDKLSIQLTGLDKTAISKEKVDVVITDKKGNVVVNKTVKTNSKGKAKIGLNLKKGKYDVNVTFGGNEKYVASDVSQVLRIKEKTTETVSDDNAVDTSKYPSYNSNIGYYRDIEEQQELLLIETSNGEYYVLGGDGYYVYDGRDSQGNIQMGSYMGKY